MAATSSARQKYQWRPSRGGFQSRDPAGSSSAHRSINDSAAERASSSSSSSSAAAAGTPSNNENSFMPTSSSSSSSDPLSASSSAALLINKKSSFIPYLPQDDAVAAGLGADQGGIDAVETQQVADILNEELRRLLRMEPSEFWKAVTVDNSILVSLDSYLQFRRRWYDSYINEINKPLAGVIVGDQELHRRVFMVLYRMSLNAESGSQPTGVAPPDESREVIYQKQIFDIPKLLDICAIYGHDNANLTRQLVNYAFARNEKLYNDLADVVPVISNTVHTMQQRCSSTLMMDLPTKSSEMSVVSRIQKELLEVLDYLNDAVVSLHAFVDAYPTGVLVLVLAGNKSDSKDQILFTLAAMHDFLIPAVLKSFSRLQKSCMDSSSETAAQTRSSRLRFSVIELAWRLFCFSYLKENNKSDSQNSVIDHLLQTYICNPRARGEGLIQVLSGMMEEPHNFVAEDVRSKGVLVRNINRKYKLLERVNQLRKRGLISLDSVQYDYAEAIVNHSNVVVSSSSLSQSVLPQSVREASEADVLNESKISHIKDILPDYGSGFIAACLEAYDNNPEEVIQRILEGTLHLSLQSLDRTLEVKPASPNTSVLVKDKGKGKVDEVASQERGSSSTSAEMQTRPETSRWQDDANNLAQRRSSSISASSSSMHEENRTQYFTGSDVVPTKNLMQGRFVRKDKGDENVESLLNERLPDDVLRTAAYAAQYEDEYDDSFDELGTHIADGVEETEILVDLARSKSSIGGGRGVNKSSGGSRSDGIGKGGWNVNNGVPRNEWKGASGMQNNNNSGEMQRNMQPQMSRGRGRGRRADPKGQFYVKDGMNYTYKVAGSVAVASAEDAEALKKVERETIHGLGQGGNVPANSDQVTDPRNATRSSGHTNSRFNHSEPPGRGAGVQSRGRGFPRKEHDHHRKDRAMQKHFAGLGGM